jgi:hypothetical protein
MSRYQGRRQYLQRSGHPTYRLIRYADLCGHPHRSAYAESRVMPSGRRNPCVVAVIGSECSA